MSWWDTKNLTKFASTALKSAQKKIDNVLEIGETGQEGSSHGAYYGDVGFDPMLSGNDFGWSAPYTPKSKPEPEPVKEEAIPDDPPSSPSKASEGSPAEEDEDSWSSWGMKSFSTLTGKTSTARKPKVQRKGLGKKLKLGIPESDAKLKDSASATTITDPVSEPPMDRNVEIPHISDIRRDAADVGSVSLETPSQIEPMLSRDENDTEVAHRASALDDLPEDINMADSVDLGPTTPVIITSQEPVLNVVKSEVVSDSERGVVAEIDDNAGRNIETDYTESDIETEHKESALDIVHPDSVLEPGANIHESKDESESVMEELTDDVNVETSLHVEIVEDEDSKLTEVNLDSVDENAANEEFDNPEFSDWNQDGWGAFDAPEIDHDLQEDVVEDTVKEEQAENISEAVLESRDIEVVNSNATEDMSQKAMIGGQEVSVLGSICEEEPDQSEDEAREPAGEFVEKNEPSDTDVLSRLEEAQSDFIAEASENIEHDDEIAVCQSEDLHQGDVIEANQSEPMELDDVIEMEEPKSSRQDDLIKADENNVLNVDDAIESEKSEDLNQDDVIETTQSENLDQGDVTEMDQSASLKQEDIPENLELVEAPENDPLYADKHSEDHRTLSGTDENDMDVTDEVPSDKTELVLEFTNNSSEPMSLSISERCLEDTENQEILVTAEPSSSQNPVKANVYEPLSVVVSEPNLMEPLQSPESTPPVMEKSTAGMWDDADLHNVQNDLVEVESDSRSSDGEMTLSGNDVTMTQDDTELSSSSQDMNASRETGTETDNSTETLKDEEESQDKAAENKEVNMDSSLISTASSVSSSSFVKCVLDDAMSEPRDDSQSTGSEKSDLVKIDSGHTSGDERDEIDTTTSSDIEIISTPNGEFPRTIDLSPLRHAFTTVRHVTSQTHRRTDSNSSSSGQSKHSDQDQLSPGREVAVPGGDHPLTGVPEQRERRISRSKSKDEVEAIQQQRQQETENLLKKLAETTEILQVRENKLVELSRENVEIRDSNQNLRTQLRQSQETLENEMMDLNAISQEFTTRLREAEKKLQNAVKERDNYKKQLQDTQDALAKSHEDTKLRQLVEEKDEQISELMAEGEKLSKHQLQSNNTIKKLRAREKELEATNKSQAEKIEKQKAEIEKLTNVRSNLETMEEKQSDIINSLNKAVVQLEKDNSQLRSETEDQKEKIRSMQVALDSSYKEIHELNKSLATKESEMQEVVIKARREAEEEMTRSREMMDSQTRDNQSVLEQQIEDLQYNLTRMEKDHHRIEDILRQELSELQIRLQEAEHRNQDVTQSVTAATRPLLRQIENLQSTYAAQASSWEKMEKSLTDQLVDAQQQCIHSSEREKFCQEKLSELQSRNSSLEGAMSLLRQEKSRLIAELETEKARANILEDTKQRDAAQIELMKSTFTQQVNDLKREKMLLESQLDMEKSKYESEKKKYALANEQLMMEKERSPSTPTPRSSSRNSDVSLPILPPLTQEEVLEHTLMMTSQNGSSKISLYESLRQNGAANLLDNLQSQLKRKEGELMLLQGEIGELEETRESMAQELVSLTTRNDELEEKLKELGSLQQQHKDLSSRYNALLQMYGEKVEEMQELELDLQDVKDMYKAQIEELLKR